jgi:hypothetical protein
VALPVLTLAWPSEALVASREFDAVTGPSTTRFWMAGELTA